MHTWQRLLPGAAAGLAATVPQSAVVWGLHRVGVYRRRPPPEVVAEGMSRPVLAVNKLPPLVGWAVKLARHFGYGAACGAVYALLIGLVRPAMLAGVLAGLAVWKASYDGWIPTLGIMPPPEQDERGRTTAMVLAHLAYGAALGLMLERITERR